MDSLLFLIKVINVIWYYNIEAEGGERMSDDNSRIDKFEKRRKTTKSITVLLILGGILIIFLLFMWVFGGDGKKSEESNEASTEIQRNENDSDDTMFDDEEDEDRIEKDESDEDDVKDENDADKEEKKEDDEEDEVETEEVEPSDANVSKAYTGNWEPVGTKQSGSHTTNYDDGSQDRIVIKEAVQLATGLQDMTEWWIANGGDQKVIATVTSPDKTDIYRVYLSWVDEKGWQPTKVEELKEVSY